MPRRLFSYAAENLRQAEEVSAILDKHHIEFYETPANHWGFTKAAIWIKDDQDFEKAKSLFEEHVEDYAQRARRAYQEQTGYNPDAPLAERIRFNLTFIYQRKNILPVVLAGIGLLVLYLYLFMQIFA
ncbi:MAG: DUF6164 family protein [Gammaproteobacteria bacterium]|nr:DUF6164 family protein [Gammaproteobacteria bacterium]